MLRIAVIIAVAGAGVGAACRAPLPGPDLRWREARERTVLQALPAELQAEFPGLAYFAYDRAARIRAMVEQVQPQALRLATSDGRVREAVRVGRVRIRLPDGAAELSLFRLPGGDGAVAENLFLPFRDAGAGKETYPAGRYVDVTPLPGGVVELDFNRAYNPDCAYGIAASCPVAPAENTVAFLIRAGEMMPPARP